MHFHYILNCVVHYRVSKTPLLISCKQQSIHIGILCHNAGSHFPFSFHPVSRPCKKCSISQTNVMDDCELPKSFCNMFHDQHAALIWLCQQMFEISIFCNMFYDQNAALIWLCQHNNDILIHRETMNNHKFRHHSSERRLSVSQCH